MPCIVYLNEEVRFRSLSGEGRLFEAGVDLPATELVELESGGDGMITLYSPGEGEAAERSLANILAMTSASQTSVVVRLDTSGVFWASGPVPSVVCKTLARASVWRAEFDESQHDRDVEALPATLWDRVKAVVPPPSVDVESIGPAMKALVANIREEMLAQEVHIDEDAIALRDHVLPLVEAAATALKAESIELDVRFYDDGSPIEADFVPCGPSLCFEMRDRCVVATSDDVDMPAEETSLSRCGPMVQSVLGDALRLHLMRLG